MASESDILLETGTIPGYIGPVGLDTYVIADQTVMNMSNFVCGANKEGFHLTQVNFDRDLKIPDLVLISEMLLQVMILRRQRKIRNLPWN